MTDVYFRSKLGSLKVSVTFISVKAQTCHSAKLQNLAARERKKKRKVEKSETWSPSSSSAIGLSSILFILTFSRFNMRKCFVGILSHCGGEGDEGDWGRWEAGGVTV